MSGCRWLHYAVPCWRRELPEGREMCGGLVSMRCCLFTKDLRDRPAPVWPWRAVRSGGRRQQCLLSRRRRVSSERRLHWVLVWLRQCVF